MKTSLWIEVSTPHIKASREKRKLFQLILNYLKTIALIFKVYLAHFIPLISFDTP